MATTTNNMGNNLRINKQRGSILQDNILRNNIQQGSILLGSILQDSILKANIPWPNNLHSLNRDPLGWLYRRSRPGLCAHQVFEEPPISIPMPKISIKTFPLNCLVINEATP